MRKKMPKSERKVNIEDVAKKAGVSTATVSRYMNNGSIKPKTAIKVKKAVEELNYVPSEAARMIASTKVPKVIKIIMPNITETQNAEILTGILKVFNIYNYNISIVLLDDSPDNLEKVISDIDSAKYVKTIIYVGKKVKFEHKFANLVSSFEHKIDDPYALGVVLGRTAIKQNEGEHDNI